MNMGNIDRAWDATTQLDFFTDINLWFCPNNGNATSSSLPALDGKLIPPASPRVPAGSSAAAPLSAIGGVHLRSRLERGHVQGHGRAVEHEGSDAAPAENLNYAPQCQTFIDKWTEQLGDDYDASGAPSSYGPTTTAWKDNVDKWCTAEFPEGPTWAEAKGVVPTEERLDGLPRVASRALGHRIRRHEMGWRRQQGGFNLFPLVDFHPGFMTASGLVEIWSLCARPTSATWARDRKGPKWAHSDLPHFGATTPLPDLPRAHRAGGEAEHRCRAR